MSDVFVTMFTTSHRKCTIAHDYNIHNNKLERCHVVRDVGTRNSHFTTTMPLYIVNKGKQCARFSDKTSKRFKAYIYRFSESNTGI